MATRTVWLALTVLALVGCATPPPPAPPPPPLVWPSPPEPARVRYVGSISRPEDIQPPKSWLKRVWEAIAGREEIQIVRPYGLAVDGEGRLYVADSGSATVHVFDQSARRYRAISAVGRRSFQMPIGVAVATDGSVFVTDAGLRTVAVFDAKGVFVREFGGDLQRPTGIAIDPGRNRVYVVDTLGHSVAVFETTGRRIGTIAQRGAGTDGLNFPTNVAVDRDGALYVTDTMNFEVKMFSPEGKLLGRFGKLGDGTGDMSRPKGIGVDSAGHIYLIEGLYDVMQVFDRRGTFLLSIGSAGAGPGQFWLPTGLHVDGKDRIYVADTYNNRVQVFEYLRGLP